MEAGITISLRTSCSATLLHLFREKGVVLTAEGQARFDALPEQFMDFVETPERFAAQWTEAA